MSFWSDLLKIIKAVQTPPTPAPAPKAMATVAFHCFDAETKEPIRDAIGTFEDETKIQANDDGYMSIVKELNTYEVKITAIDYEPTKREVVLVGNKQFEVPMLSTKVKPVPPPTPVPMPGPLPPSTPYPPVPPAPSVPVTDEDFKAAFFAILKKHNAPRTVNLQTLNDTKADVEAIGCEWQHTSGGELRPRLFLPVNFGNDPYGRPYDVGLYGEPWTWIKRY